MPYVAAHWKLRQKGRRAYWWPQLEHRTPKYHRMNKKKQHEKPTTNYYLDDECLRAFEDAIAYINLWTKKLLIFRSRFFRLRIACTTITFVCVKFTRSILDQLLNNSDNYVCASAHWFHFGSIPKVCTLRWWIFAEIVSNRFKLLFVVYFNGRPQSRTVALHIGVDCDACKRPIINGDKFLLASTGSLYWWFMVCFFCLKIQMVQHYFVAFYQLNDNFIIWVIIRKNVNGPKFEHVTLWYGVNI